jgi:hypothetical protein
LTRLETSLDSSPPPAPVHSINDGPFVPYESHTDGGIPRGVDAVMDQYHWRRRLDTIDSELTKLTVFDQSRDDVKLSRAALLRDRKFYVDLIQ